jgi:uncharacterized ferritin-like protein (DUF455 family)
LDSAERLINKFEAYGDKESAKIMKLICEEEIGHVKIGVDWYELRIFQYHTFNQSI